MARVLIVGCGCRGLELAAAITAEGHIVRGTSRSEAGAARIGEAGAEGVVADPDRLATLTPHLEAVSVLCWLMASALGDAAPLHGPRLETLLWKLVDTHVRGMVYEAAGTVDRQLLDGGAGIVRRMRQTYNMPTEAVEQDPTDHHAWAAAMAAAVDRVLSA